MKKKKKKKLSFVTLKRPSHSEDKKKGLPFLPRIRPMSRPARF